MKQHFSPELRPTRFDVLVAAAVAVLAIVLAFWFYGGLGRSGPATYIITHQGQEIARGELRQPREITVEGQYHLQIVCDGESIAVTHSDCPTQDCVRTGRATHPGQSIVCLPEQVVIKLVGSGSGPDLVIG